ncbi:sensor histidine kinase [Adlercreutzia caecimuris]|uniref:sensor histidine kinase n=1 Tax=Adlercreutzia caecimuris TaxID=671266 RepID=UPI002590BE6B|nr:ATP-binding protein [Adlercreutzia caecimuris]
MRIKLRTKIAVLVLGVVTVFLCANVLWESERSAKLEEAELVQQARALSANMEAVWEFMNKNQDKINYDSAGNFEFKGLQCSIAGRSVGAFFSRDTDYSVRYVSDTPRNVADTPDAFEQAAIDAFRANPHLTEYYEFAEVDGRQVFRFAEPMDLEASCLSCHGEPAGEIDLSGYPREGLPDGYVYGALSMEIPTEAFVAASHQNAALNIGFSLALIVACVAIISVAMSHLVTRPLTQVRSAMEEVGEGDYSARLPVDKSSDEMTVLSSGFNEMAAQLEKAAGHLEELVAERTLALEHAYGELERQSMALEKANEALTEENQYRSDFLAMMSHELKTPLAASMAFADILRERRAAGGAPTAEDERLWREMEGNHKTLLSLINNILEMARIDAGRESFHPELMDIGDVVGLVQTTIAPLAGQKSIALECRVGNVPLFVADAEKLRRIVENLMSNAVKFTPAGGRIVFAVEHRAEAGLIELSVADTGCGIPEASQATIFDRFVQADSSSSRAYGGSGLGLALVRELAEMHGGTVALESAVGEGSTFTVSIPDDIPLIDATDERAANVNARDEEPREGHVGEETHG